MAIDPDQDCNALIDWLMQFAERQLANHGEFFPFGGAMAMDGTMSFVATYDGDEHPDSSNLIESLKKAFIDGARRCEYRATALVYDVKVKLPTTGQTSDAVAVSLNHRDDYSFIGFFPYSLKNGKPDFGASYAVDGEADIFPKSSHH
jgi:hypothetical protein